MPRLTETRALRAKLPKRGQKFDWCSEVKGFGARITAAGARSYVVQCQWGDKEPRITLGPVGVLPFEGPPKAPGALDFALAALNAARRGEDPKLAISSRRNPDGVTLADIWRANEDAGYPKLKGIGRKRPTTIRADKNRYQVTLQKQLGDEPINRIDTPRVRRWLDTIETEGQRSHALVLLKSLLSFAQSRGLATPHKIAIASGRSREKQDFYTPDELAHLDQAMIDLIADRPAQVLPFSALRLLLATGARLSEILSLTWNAVNLEQAVLHLERDKTSENRRDILLTPVAVDILKALPRTSSPFVFPADSKSGHYVEVQKHWIATIERAKVRRLRKHDLRHSFASTAIGQGVPLYTVGKLLGHRLAQTTARYSHLEQDVAREALDRVAASIKKAI